MRHDGEARVAQRRNIEVVGSEEALRRRAPLRGGCRTLAAARETQVALPGLERVGRDREGRGAVGRGAYIAMPPGIVMQIDTGAEAGLAGDRAPVPGVEVECREQPRRAGALAHDHAVVEPPEDGGAGRQGFVDPDQVVDPGLEPVRALPYVGTEIVLAVDEGISLRRQHIGVGQQLARHDLLARRRVGVRIIHEGAGQERVAREVAGLRQAARDRRSRMPPATPSAA